MRKFWKAGLFLDIGLSNWTFGCTISIIIVRQCMGNNIMILYILSVGKGPREGGEMMTKNSVKLYFSGEGSDGSKRNFSRTVNYIREDANNEDLKVFRAAFGTLLAKEITKLERVTVTEL